MILDHGWICALTMSFCHLMSRLLKSADPTYARISHLILSRWIMAVFDAPYQLIDLILSLTAFSAIFWISRSSDVVIVNHPL